MPIRFLIIFLFVVFSAMAPRAEAAPASTWVFYGADGKLQYNTTAEGGKILDYSGVGYEQGKKDIPLVPAVLTLNATGTSADDTARIQTAINQVAAMPLVNGFRGAIQFNVGTFNIASQLNINTSGIVLRGAGQGTNGTTFLATTPSSYDVIRAAPPSGSSTNFTRGSNPQVTIADSYIPVGATSFTVPAGQIGTFAVGDKIVINRPSTQKWIDDIGMGAAAPPAGLGPDEDWTPSSSHLQMDRTITAISGNTVTVNAGITTAIDSRTIGGVTNAYGGGTIFEYTTNRVNNVGIENLRFDTVHTSPTDVNHANRPIVYSGVFNGWIRNTTTIHYYNGASIAEKSEFVTSQDNMFRDPVGDTTTGGHALVGQWTLLQRNTTYNARAPFVTQASNTAGPDVFVFGSAIASLQSIGPHQKWASGVLWDNMKVTGNAGIELINRGQFGTGHGWAGANMVSWNTQASWVEIDSPPTAQNWSIGSVGTKNNRFPGTLGIEDSYGTKVAPNSLYIAQLKQALGPQPAAKVVRTFTVGDNDNFLNEGASDVPFVDPNWKVLVESDLPGTGTARGFDDATTAARHAATINYSLFGGEKVVSATLTMKLKALATVGATDSFFLDSPGMELDFDMLGLTSPSWTSGVVKTVTIDLTDIFGPLLSPLQNGQLSDGVFNLAWNGNVAIDFVQLDLGIVPEPTSIMLLLAGAMGAGTLCGRAMMRRRRA